MTRARAGAGGVEVERVEQARGHAPAARRPPLRRARLPPPPILVWLAGPPPHPRTPRTTPLPCPVTLDPSLLTLHPSPLTLDL
eukprot:3454210-Rhodomonas_salina.1